MSSKPFDATLKELVEQYPADWLAQCGFGERCVVQVIEAELSTITTQSDKVIRVDETPAWLFHIELQASGDSTLMRRLLKYNVLLHDRHQLPVHTTVVLLRPDADRPHLTTAYGYTPPRGAGSLEFRFQVVRIWEQPPELFLGGGLGILPLAPLTALSPEELPPVIERMGDRIQREGTPHERASLWTATYLLMGLRYPESLTEQLLQGVCGMEESVTYQAILRKGETKGRVEGQLAEARRLLLRLGRKHLGSPSAELLSAIEAIHEVERLEQLAERCGETTTWGELLATI